MVMMVTQRPFTELVEGLTFQSYRQDTDISIISDFGGKTPRVNALRFHIYCIYVGLCHGLKMLVRGYGHPSHGTDEKCHPFQGGISVWARFRNAG